MRVMRKTLDDAVAASLVGRTITRALAFDESPDDLWSHHETFWLWLDDGRVVEFSSWGHDADGATLNEIEEEEVKDFATTRPDLPHCERCNDGQKCYCQIYVAPLLEPDEVIACACLGFSNCPECPRGRGGSAQAADLRAAQEAAEAAEAGAAALRAALRRISLDDDSPCEDGRCEFRDFEFCERHSPWAIARAALDHEAKRLLRWRKYAKAQATTEDAK